MNKGIYINDSIHGLIQLSHYEKKIISSIGFNRLHDVYQNSTVYLTFPTNRTKRFEHSLGTMKLCSDMLFSAIKNASNEDLEKFYKMFTKEYTNLLKNKICKDKGIINNKLITIPDNLPEIEITNFKYSLIPSNVPAEYYQIHLLIIQSLRVAALLHDIGHPPYSHVIEDSLSDIYKWAVNEKPNKRKKDFCKKLSTFYKTENNRGYSSEIKPAKLHGSIYCQKYFRRNITIQE